MALVTILTILVVVYRAWRSLGGLTSYQLNRPPKHGPETTLVVTDIENSTVAWEMLELEIMDSCINSHNECVRSVMRIHHGFESATEGDSFIMAFHTSSMAVDFAVQLQLEMLKIQWPEELLQLSSFRPVTASIPSSPTDSRRQSRSSLAQVVVLSEQSAVVLGTEPFQVPGQQLGCNVTAGSGRDSPGDQTPKLPTLQSVRSNPIKRLARIMLGHRESDELASPVAMEVRAHQSALCCTYLAELQTQYCSPREALEGPLGLLKHELMFQGLRVRVGIYSGVEADAVVYNKTEKRTQYTGIALQHTKAVCDAAQGGQILLSDTAFSQMSHSNILSLNASTLLLHMGEWQSETGAYPEQATALYQALPTTLMPRLAFLSAKGRGLDQVSNGVVDAPVGRVSILFMHLDGFKMLSAWNPTVMAKVTAIFENTVSALLFKFNGYLVEMCDGLLLATFSSARDAIGYALIAKKRLTLQEWPEELLENGLCTEVVSSEDDSGDDDEEEGARPPRRLSTRLAMSPRIKAGVDCSSSVRTHISPSTGRMTYRGRAMNRAARIAAKAPGGVVLCSDDAWKGYTSDPRKEEIAVLGCSKGKVMLKGIGHVGIVTCQPAGSLTASFRAAYYKQSSAVSHSSTSVRHSREHPTAGRERRRVPSMLALDETEALSNLVNTGTQTDAWVGAGLLQGPPSGGLGLDAAVAQAAQPLLQSSAAAPARYGTHQHRT
ncbi:MAG: hypothetical protein WDW38_010132 [Sanguina aurantia]